MISKLLGEPVVEDLISRIYLAKRDEYSPSIILNKRWDTETYELSIIPKLKSKDKIQFVTSPRRTPQTPLMPLNDVINFYDAIAFSLEAKLINKLAPKNTDFSKWIRLSQREKLDLIGIKDYSGNLLQLFEAWNPQLK